MKKRVIVILFMMLWVMPLVFAGITGSVHQNEEDIVIENNIEEVNELDDSDSGISIEEVKDESNSITGSVTEENSSKGFFEKFIDWIKGLLS